MIRLIRSKGVGIYFITQSPADIPVNILGQLGNRVQHALRAYTPNEQRALRYAAKSFRVNPDFDTETVLQELGTGEALVSVLDPKGVPTVVQQAGILPPRSSMNAAEESEVQKVIRASALKDKYTETVDRESAYEILAGKAEEAAKAKEEAEKEAQEAAEAKAREKEEREEERQRQKEEREKAKKKAARKNSATAKAAQKVVNSTASTIGRELGKSILRGLFGNLKK